MSFFTISELKQNSMKDTSITVHRVPVKHITNVNTNNYILPYISVQTKNPSPNHMAFQTLLDNYSATPPSIELNSSVPSSP